MLTTQPISTISFNSIEYLSKVLKQLFEERYINFFSYVYHFKEEDEKKDHIHVYMIPNKRVDTDSLRERFFEFVDSNELPLACLPFVNSKWSEWYLYNSHNEKYLASKGLVRKYHYKDSDFVNSDDMQFTELLHTIDWNKLNGQERFINMIRSGMTFKEIVNSGVVPVQLFHQYKNMYKTMGGRDPEHRVPVFNADGELYAYDIVNDDGDFLRREYKFGNHKLGAFCSSKAFAQGGASEGEFISPDSHEQS